MTLDMALLSLIFYFCTMSSRDMTIWQCSLKRFSGTNPHICRLIKRFSGTNPHICSIYGFIWLLLTSGSKRFYIFGYKCDCSTIYGYKCDCNTIYVFDLAKFDKIKNKIIILESFSFWSFQYNDVKLCSYL